MEQWVEWLTWCLRGWYIPEASTVMKVRQNDILYKQEIVACVYECPSTELPGGHRLVRAARLLSLLLHSGRGSIMPPSMPPPFAMSGEAVMKSCAKNAARRGRRRLPCIRNSPMWLAGGHRLVRAVRLLPHLLHPGRGSIGAVVFGVDSCRLRTDDAGLMT